MGLWQQYRDWRRRHLAAIEPRTAGFRLRHGQASRDVDWDDVREIVAFKRDLYTTDCICLALLLADGVVEVDEEMVDFIPFREAMEQRFGLSADWYIAIMTPVFEPTPMRLYPKAAAA